MDLQRKFVGTMVLGNKVDITDPCYDKGTWCRMTTKCKPGTYYGYADMVDEGEWGERVASIQIYLDDVQVDDSELESIGRIGVDAGLAGFFQDKPDFNDDEWNELCDKLASGDEPKDYWVFDGNKGIFSNSGYGDGGYTVFANKERTAFQIVFITAADIEE